MEIIHERNTPYGKLTVEDSDEGIIRGVFIDGVSQGRYNVATQSVQSWYMQEIVDKVSAYPHPEYQSALVLGGGAGLLTTALERLGMVCDSVEQSADMLLVAQEYFNFNPKGRVILGDAMVKLKDLGKYDLIIIDLFNGLVEAANFDFEGLFSHLKPRGHVISNSIINNKNFVIEVSSQ